MINPHRIKYNNIFSNELNIPDLIMCVAMDSDNGETPSFLNRDVISSESHDGRYKRIHRFKYTETFAPKFTFFKKDLSNFEMDEVRTTLKWLTSRDTTSLLETYYDDSNVVTWASIGGFVDLQTYKIANNRTIAITAVWDSISPFAFSDLYTVTKTTTATDNKIIINIDTDDNQPVYPRITIQQNGAIIPIPSGVTFNLYSDMIPNAVYYNGATYYWKSDESALCTGAAEPNYGWTKIIRDSVYSETDEMKDKTVYYYTSDQKYRWIDPYTFKSSTTNPNLQTTGVKIINQHYDLFNKASTPVGMIVKNNASSEKVVIDGANKIISSSSIRRIFGDDFEDWSWLPLYDGKNELTIEGNCTVTVEWREVRKIGEW
jgi:hypothetical protein